MNYLQNICYRHCTLFLYQSQLRPNLRGRGRDPIPWWVECWRICVHGYKSITLLFLRAYLFLLVCSFWFRSANLFLATRQSTNISKKHTPPPIKLCSESSVLLTSIQISWLAILEYFDFISLYTPWNIKSEAIIKQQLRKCFSWELAACPTCVIIVSFLKTQTVKAELTRPHHFGSCSSTSCSFKWETYRLNSNKTFKNCLLCKP